MKNQLIILLISFSFFASCVEDNDNLPSVEERVAAANSALLNELTAPENGWKLEYQPTPQSGIFYMILKFNENGQVTIKSDVANEGGEFFELTTPFRIDNKLGLELIMETYGVFHYLFELDQNTFGAEFEFIYKRKEDGNLIFESKTDEINPTQLIFEPASANDENLFSREIAENIEAFSGVTPDELVRVPPIQQLLLDDLNISIFWSLDPAKRTIEIDMAGEGSTIEEIIANDNYIGIFHNSGYALLDGKLVLRNPLTIPIGGSQITISEITLDEFSMTGPSLCPVSADPGPKYTGQVAGLGAATLLSSYFTLNGSDFVSNNLFSVNAFFVFDGDGNSLTEGGIIETSFPDASGFAFIYDVELVNDSIPSSSVGLILENGDLVVQAFEAVQTGNLIKLNLLDSFYVSGLPSPETEMKIAAVNNEIFEGGEIYAFNFPQDNVFRLFNPCNGYEIFLVR